MSTYSYSLTLTNPIQHRHLHHSLHPRLQHVLQAGLLCHSLPPVLGRRILPVQHAPDRRRPGLPVLPVLLRLLCQVRREVLLPEEPGGGVQAGAQGRAGDAGGEPGDALAIHVGAPALAGFRGVSPDVSRALWLEAACPLPQS